MVAHPVDPAPPVFHVAFGAFPGHSRLPAPSAQLAWRRILTPQCLLRQIMEPLPLVTDAGIHLVIGVCALDDDPDLGGAALRADATAMQFLTGKNDVKIN